MTAADQQALISKLSDPLWRMTSGELYKIVPANGTGLQPFLPRPEQVKVLELIMSGHRQLMIPKARRLGMSTVLGIYVADCLLFRKTWQGSLIDKTQNDASVKLRKIVKVAIDNLPEWILQRIVFKKKNDSELILSMNGTGEAAFSAGMNARGGSNDFLWVSEWGFIQHDDPGRSADIRTGALPSARHGVTVVETTWAGGEGGDVWELIQGALKKENDDWRLFFAPWWLDPRNVDQVSPMDQAALDYFAKADPRLAEMGVTLSESQKRWWAKERRAQGIYMGRENPTFQEECWSTPVRGAIYAEEIAKALAEGRIVNEKQMPVDGSNLIHTVWDLGAPANTCVWYFQVVGREIRMIDCDIGDKGTLTQRWAYMTAKGYSFGTHFLPHDAATTERSGGNFSGALVAAGVPSPSIKILARTADIWYGINHAKELINAVSFRLPQCEDGLKGLKAYHTKVVGEGTGSYTSEEPVHDWASHIADPFRYMAEAHMAGLFRFTHTTAQPRPDWFAPQHRQALRPQRKVPMRVG